MSWGEILETIHKYWLQFLLGLSAGALGTALARLKKSLRWRKSVNDAILAVLHDRLFAECQRVLSRDPCVVTEEELENLELMFKSYEELGGNGTIKKLMERIRQYAKIVPSVPAGQEVGE